MQLPKQSVISIHPGVSLDDVIASTGWDLKISQSISKTPFPTKDELEALHKFDPDKFWTS